MDFHDAVDTSHGHGDSRFCGQSKSEGTDDKNQHKPKGQRGVSVTVDSRLFLKRKTGATHQVNFLFIGMRDELDVD